jgi:hypothetical protein
MDHVVVCNPGTKVYLENTLCVRPGKVTVIPAYVGTRSRSWVSVPPEVMELRKEVRVLVLASGWVGSRLGGSDTYGFDVLLRALRLLRAEGRSIGVVVGVSGGPGAAEEALRSGLRAANVPSVVTRDLQGLHSIMESIDVYVRPSRTDGDSIAVREALEHGTRVIASDAVERPAGCVIVETGNAMALAGSLRRIDFKGKAVPVQDASEGDLNGERLVELYRELGVRFEAE